MSAYELEAKAGTRFTHAHGAELARQSDAMESYFELVVERLTGAGYRWYETANFCRTPSAPAGATCARAHNLGIWRGHDYLGLGIGAVSTIDGRRWRNAPSLPRYIAALERGERPPREVEELPPEVRDTERLMLGLRLDEPLPLAGLGTPSTRSSWRGSSPQGSSREERGSPLADAARARPRRRRHRPPARLTASATAVPTMGLCRSPLSERQRDILRRVVEEYVATSQPVGSKTLVERAGLDVSSSTVRNELAELERLGLLTHPHTSAGRVPTEAGYRLYVDALLTGPEPPGPSSRSACRPSTPRSRKRCRRRPRCSRR